MCAAPPCDYKRRRRASFRLSRFARFARFSRSLSLSEDAQTLLGLSYCGHLRSRSSPYPTPLLAETWEFPSLSRLACTPYYKHIGCKIIQCPRTPPLLDVRPRGRNQDKPCVTVLSLASSSGTRKHATFTRWDPAPGSGHRLLACQVGRRYVTFFLSCSHLIFRDGEQIQPIPYGCFGSAPSGICDLVRESRVQSDRQRLPHAAPLAQTQPHHPDFTSPAQQALGLAFATSTRGAASRGTPQLPHVGRGWHVATQHHGQRGHHFVISCLGVICAATTVYCSTSTSQGGLDLTFALPLRDA